MNEAFILDFLISRNSGNTLNISENIPTSIIREAILRDLQVVFHPDFFQDEIFDFGDGGESNGYGYGQGNGFGDGESCPRDARYSSSPSCIGCSTGSGNHSKDLQWIYSNETEVFSFNPSFSFYLS